MRHRDFAGLEPILVDNVLFGGKSQPDRGFCVSSIVFFRVGGGASKQILLGRSLL